MYHYLHKDLLIILNTDMCIYGIWDQKQHYSELTLTSMFCEHTVHTLHTHSTHTLHMYTTQHAKLDYCRVYTVHAVHTHTTQCTKLDYSRIYTVYTQYTHTHTHYTCIQQNAQNWITVEYTQYIHNTHTHTTHAYNRIRKTRLW